MQGLTRPLKRYLVIYALCYFCFAIVTSIISHFIDVIESIYMVAAFSTAAYVSARFVKDEGRAPTSQERDRLTNGSFSVFIALTALVVLARMTYEGVVLKTPTTDIFLATIVGLMIAIMIGLTYFMLHLAYGWIAIRYDKKHNPKR